MQLSQQVVSLEQAKRLKELGVDAPSLFRYLVQDGHVSLPFYRTEVNPLLHMDADRYPAYSVSELGEMLPMYCTLTKTHTGWDCTYETRPTGIIHSEGCHPSPASAMCAMLIYLIENNHINAASVNEAGKK